MWRWSYMNALFNKPVRVFSTYVEMILKEGRNKTVTVSILHVCGDDPPTNTGGKSILMYSPRMWRWSLSILPSIINVMVFSTYVEMIPNSTSSKQVSYWYSPRMWRWSSVSATSTNGYLVFSTYVEMIPIWFNLWHFIECILHVCGDDPMVCSF